MENKICSYTEKNVRLQLVRVEEETSIGTLVNLEIRFNRKVLSTYPSDFATEAKLYFLHCSHKILMDRSLSDLTT